MAEFSTFRDQDGPVELKIVMTRAEAAILLAQLKYAKMDQSPAREFFVALEAAATKPKLH